MKKGLLLTLLCFIFLVSFASAKISLTDVNELYSLGDNIYLTITTIPSSTYGFFEVDIVCGNTSLIIEKFIASRLTVGEEQTTTTTFPLIPAYIGKLTGECHLLATLGLEQITTNPFIISNELITTATLDKPAYDPGEPIKLTIQSTKSNGHNLNGFIEVSGAKSISKIIENGFTTETFIMPETTESGTYTLSIFTYDTPENSREILNHNRLNISFDINQLPQFIDISLAEIEATPGEDFEFGLDLYDQSGTKMEGSISVSILDPENNERQLIANAGEKAIVNFLTNSTPGEYRIAASFENLLEIKEFTMQSIQKVDFEFLESILIVKNIGNELYNKTIKVKIGEETQTLKLHIGVGEERRFNLNAPDGEYDVSVGDGDDSTEKTLLLTGKAISIRDLTSGSIFKKYPLIWTFILIIVVLVIIVLLVRHKGKTINVIKKIKRPFSRSSKDPRIKGGENNNKKILDLSGSSLGEAESGLVTKGSKSKSAVISISIKNPGELEQEAKKQLRQIIETSKEDKGMVEFKQDHIMVVFSPLVTKTFKNEILSAKTGFRIFKRLQEYNKKFENKINFNIGINSGDIISSLENKKLKYTGIGNTIALAKKISDSANDKILVSKQIKSKLLRELKTRKVGIVGNTEVFEIETISDNKANQEKLQEILKRMKREENRS